MGQGIEYDEARLLVRSWRDKDSDANFYLGRADGPWPSISADEQDGIIRFLGESGISFAHDTDKAIVQMKQVLRQVGVLTTTCLKRGKDF